MDLKYPTLAILPVDRLLIHEHHDESRCLPLIERIQSSSVFTNPVVVTPLQDRTGRYMVLDGANRTTALRMMDFPHILTQVVEPDALGVSTGTWNHVVWGLDSESFLRGIWAIPDLTLRESTALDSPQELTNHRALVALHLPDSTAFTAHTPARNAIERTRFLNAVVDSYKDRAEMDRTPLYTVAPFLETHPDLTGLVCMPSIEISHLLYLAGEGHMLPAGVTRFTVSPRALRVNFPLEILADKTRPLKEKNESLDAWVRTRYELKGIRYYEEETVLYDE